MDNRTKYVEEEVLGCYTDHALLQLMRKKLSNNQGGCDDRYGAK